MSAAAFQSRQVRRWQSGGLGTRVSLSRCARKRADTSSDTAVGGMVSRSQKLINRLRPLLNRLVGSAERNSSHRGSDCLGCRGWARTSAARKLEQRLLQVFRLRSCLAGRTALISGRMCRREGGVILGGCHVAAAPICGHDRGPRSVIDRLLKNQNHWKIAIIFGHPRRTLVLDRHPGNRAAILRSEIHRHESP